jgi:SLT domain-containing protein
MPNFRGDGNREMPGRAGGGSVSRQRASPVNADRQKDFTFHTTRARPDSEQEVLRQAPRCQLKAMFRPQTNLEVEAVLPVARARPLTMLQETIGHAAGISRDLKSVACRYQDCGCD